MIKFQNLKKEIISGAIVSIVLFFGQSIGQYLWNLTLKFSINTYSGFIDYVYKNAALGQRNWIDFIIFYALMAYGTYNLLRMLSSIREKIYDYDLEEKLENSSDDAEKEEIINKLTIKKRRRFELIMKHQKKVIFATYIFQIFYFFSFTIFTFFTYIDLQLNTSFNQRLNIISPYIDEQKEELYKSKWGLMESRSDYEFIMNDIKNVAKKNKIKLPSDLVK